MSLIAEFTVESDDFALYQSLTAAPEMLVEIEEVVATMGDRVMPYFWVSGGDRDEFEAEIREDPSVQDITKVDEVGTAVLYRANWTQNIESVVYAYVEIGATILQASGQSDEWELRMRFDDTDAVGDFREYCREKDISYDLTKLSEQDQPMATSQYGLTEKQRQALVAARDAGYFRVPQEVTLDELATELDISPQALSKRLHHGHHSLITSTLTIGRQGE